MSRAAKARSAFHVAFGAPAQAALVDLGAAGSFNAYTLGNFSMSSVDTEGSIASGGNIYAGGTASLSNTVALSNA